MGALFSSNLSVKAWKSAAEYPNASDYPETKLASLTSKPNTALCLSGGGSRAMISAFGFLAGLRDLGLLENVRYISSVSGGAWASSVFLYSTLTDDDDVLLGPIVNPEDITLANLNHLDEKCVRRLASRSFLEKFYGLALIYRTRAWLKAISADILTPAGIHEGKHFTWDEDTLQDILKRNGHLGLKREDFLLPRKKNRPFFITGWTLLGPQLSIIDEPYDVKNRNYSYFEVTPLYVGQMKESLSKYDIRGNMYLSVGGVIEPYAFALEGGGAPRDGLGPKQTEGILKVPKPRKMLDLTNATSTSSLAPLSELESIAVINVLFSWSYNYWSPRESHPRARKTLFGDGGSILNTPIIPCLQRGVEKIISATFTGVLTDFVGLNRTEPWKTKKIGPKLFAEDVAALFGILPTSKADTKYYEYTKSHVFKTEEFKTLIHGLEHAFEKGSGAVYRHIFTTVDNRFFGIPADKKFDITFYILSISTKWSDKLPSDVKTKVFIDAQENNKSSLFDSCMQPIFPVDYNEFYNFPHYSIVESRFTHSESNLLADMVGWTVVNNAEIFNSVLKPDA